MTPEPARSPAGSVLFVRTPDAERSLSAGRSYYIGRDPQSDIVVNDSRVSWRHALFRLDGSNWLLEDVGSTNGTFQDRSRVQRVSIAGSCSVRLGHPDDGPVLSCSVSAPARRAEDVHAGQAQPTRYAESPAPPNPAVNRMRANVAAGAQAPGGGFGPG